MASRLSLKKEYLWVQRGLEAFLFDQNRFGFGQPLTAGGGRIPLSRLLPAALPADPIGLECPAGSAAVPLSGGRLMRELSLYGVRCCPKPKRFWSIRKVLAWGCPLTGCFPRHEQRLPHRHQREGFGLARRLCAVDRRRGEAAARSSRDDAQGPAGKRRTVAVLECL